MERKIGSKVITLTKNILLSEPTEEKGYLTQFMVGKATPFLFSGFGKS
jgi:hypothetical protein